MSSSSSSTTRDNPAAETRAERIARYKEQRRKQLSAQYGAKEQNVIGSSKLVVASTVNESSQIRTTRTSRLRAAAAAAAASLTGTGNNVSSESCASSSPRLEATSTPTKEVQRSPVNSRLEKDKSAKRKSNLNRSTCSEETPDQNDDKSRRRRRRFFPPDVFSSSTTASSPSNNHSTPPSLESAPTSTASSSLTSLFKSTTSSSSSYIASPIAVATAVAVSLTTLSSSSASREQGYRTTANREQGQVGCRTATANKVQGQAGHQPTTRTMGGVVGRDGRGDVNRMDGAIRKMSSGENGRKGSLGGAQGKGGSVAPSSPRSPEERNHLTSRSNKENTRSRRLPNSTSKSQEPLSRRLDQLTALTQETLAKVKSLETKPTTIRSRSGSKSPISVEQSKIKPNTRGAKSSKATAVLEQAAPVSILKRKVSQEECKSLLQTPPVTFSPSVIDPPVTTSKRQGILKKRRSLDESQVMRHRSCSPDKSDSRSSILKHQKRRSSLEEIAHRVNSPETIPGILKRKTLRNHDYDDVMDYNASLNSPQSILKQRKSGASSAGSTQDRYVPHVSIATAVILAAADGAEMILEHEHVKPILKKKSFSEESGIEVVGDGLKPILKKKSSTDTDDCNEERPKRPILKLRSFQQDSLEYYDCNKSRSSLNNDSGSECDVKPILKQNKESELHAKPRLSFCEGTNSEQQSNIGEYLEANASGQVIYYDSSSDCEFKPILKRGDQHKHRLSFCSSSNESNEYSRMRNPSRRSNTICATDFCLGSKVLDKEVDRDLQKPRTLSVLELVKSFETTTVSSGAIPKKSSLKRHNSERFKTQPITMHELQASAHIQNNLSPTSINLQPDSPLSSVTPPPHPNNFYSLFSLEADQHSINLQSTSKNLAQSKSDTELLSLPTSSSLLHVKSTSSELYSCEVRAIAEVSSSVSERGGIMSSDSAFQSLGDGLELDGSSDDEIEVKVGAKFSGIVMVVPSTPPNAGLREIVGTKRQLKGKCSRTKKDEESSSRFSTQPVTTEEVAEAAKLGENARNSEEEYEPAHMSIKDKINLFKSKATEGSTLKVPKRREIRRSTQPITMDEVEIASKIPDKLKIDSESSPSETIKPILTFKLPALITKPTNRQVLSPSRVTSEQAIACDEGISSDSGSDSEPTTRSAANRVARRIARETQTATTKSLINSALESNSDESSGGKEVQSIISNEAMAAVKKRRENLIYKSKSHVALPSSALALTKIHLGGRQDDFDDSTFSKSKQQSNAAEGSSSSLIYRSVTQSHLAPKGSSIDNSTSAIAMRRNMICELQQQLAQSGNSDWLKRRHKLNGASEELTLLQSNNERNDELNNGKPSILAAKLDELDASSKTWKTRVEKSDAVNFSVAGKMQEKDVLLNIPTPDKHKRTPLPKRFKGKLDCELDTSSTPVSPDFEKNAALKRSNSVQPTFDESAVTPKKLTNNTVIVRTVKINRPDDETFSSFFENTVVTSNEKVDIDDLDCITRESNTLLVQKKNIQVVKRRVASRNPVKTLAKRSDLRSEYTEVSTGVIERETKRLNMEKLAQFPSCNLAMEALAGLASKEDFSSVVLKKSSQVNPSQHLPYSSLMLLQIKGRRHIQTRLVEPTLESINLGDNYLLITPNCLYSFTGTAYNVIEQSRAQDIANYILQTADLGCKTTRIVNVDVAKPSQDLDQFRKLLGGKENELLQFAGEGHPDEDEIYETSIIETNMIYKLDSDELVPYADYWGCIPKVAMLDEKQCLVFDFGSEMYIWSGKTADRDRKKTTLRLAKELWSTGYNYTDCSICPINVSKKLGSRSIEPDDDLLKGETRPSWALFAKLTQNRETILFKEKFSDWPDFTRVIRIKSPSRQDKCSSDFQIKPLEIPERDLTEPNFIVENTSLGRGKEYFDEETRRNFEISTKDVTCWNIMENTYEKLEDCELGHFYEGDTYIIRWNFRVTVTGKGLDGKPSKHLQLGRDRCCYFCWFGKTATINEKGTAALLTVELDCENAKQYRITQEHEPPAFLQLFNSKMKIYKGKREKTNKSAKKLFMVRGHSVEEASLLEVSLVTSSLRSRTSFILQELDGSVKIWHGSKSLQITRDNAKYIVQENFKNSVNELFEEKGDILMMERDGRSFVSLKREERYDFTARLFYFSSVSGSFEVTELLPSDRKCDVPTPYPILQSDLYNENQPALFLLDNRHTLYLWHGWWPTPTATDAPSPPLSPTPSSTPSSGSDTPELPADLNGSARVRWHAERRAAMLTAVKYYHTERFDDEKVDLQQVPVKLVWAGVEPDEFVALFPTWDAREDVKVLNMKEEKVPGQTTPLHEELTLLSRDRFTLDELKQRPLPIGVDPTHLETYLSNIEFESLLKMNREEFNRLPTWKQATVKKEHGLF